jgi:surface protein
MAIITAQAKLYQGFRCYVVDKNITANLSSAFTLGNLGNRVDPKDGSTGYITSTYPTAGFTLYSNVKFDCIVRTIADLFSVPTISLTQERYKTYGFGNVAKVITPAGQITGFSQPSQTVNQKYFGVYTRITPTSSRNQTAVPRFTVTVSGTGGITLAIAEGDDLGKLNVVGDTLTFKLSQLATLPTGTADVEFTSSVSSVTTQTTTTTTGWTSTSTLICKFPTYFRLDVEALGLPEGVDCIVKMEEGFILEGNYPGTFNSPNPRNESFVSFRTPKVYRSNMNTLFTVPSTRGLRIKQLASSISSLATVVARGVFNPGKLAALEFSVASFGAVARKTAKGVAALSSIATIITNNIKILSSAIPTFASIATFVSNTNNSRIRFFQSQSNAIVASTTIDTALSRRRNTSSAVSAVAALSGTAMANRNIGAIPNLSATTSIAIDFDIFKILEPVNLAATSSVTVSQVSKPMTIVMNGDSDIVYMYLKPSHNLTIAWGDGQVTTHNGSSSNTWNYGDGSVNQVVYGDGSGVGITKYYGPLPNSPARIVISGTMSGWLEGGIITNGGLGVDKIESFGEIGMTNLPRFGLINAFTVPNHIPSTVTSIANTFYNANLFNDSAVTYWNTSNVTNMSNCFYMAESFNQDLSSWNTSNVTNMSGMFSNAHLFNQPLNSWNTSKVTNMSSMFEMGDPDGGPAIDPYGVFNQSLSSWDVSKVTNMSKMFKDCKTFNQSLSSWNPVLLQDASGMFDMTNVWYANGTGTGASAFNSAMFTNTPALTNMNRMFQFSRFNHSSINSMNVSNVTDMGYLFYHNQVFNQPLNSWNTSKVTNMSWMLGSLQSFETTFNQNLSTWDVSKVTNFQGMFSYSGVYGPTLQIQGWRTTSATNMEYMFDGVYGMNSLTGWCVSNIPTQPANFGPSSWTTKPIWGTCP